MKNIFIVLFFFLLNISLFSNDMAIKLLENSYEQLNNDFLECQVEEKRIYKQSSDLADHLTLRSKIEELKKRRTDLKTMLDQLIENYEKTSKKDSNEKDDNSKSEGGNQTGNTNKPPKGEKTKDPQTGTEKNTDKDKKVTEDHPTKKNKPKEKLVIKFNKKVVKPGKTLVYTVVPPKHFLQATIVWIKCSSNLSTIDSSPMGKNLRGHLVADPLITRQQNASVSALVKDLETGLNEKARAVIVISAYTQETKIGLEVPSRMVSGRSYKFLVKVPSDFKPPFSILVKSSLGKHLIVHTTTTSLGGAVKAWGNGDPKVILSGSISARVYDDSGKIGYVNKLVSIDEPTQEELNEIPMEKPPTWYEEAATYTWKATKDTMKATGEAMKATGEVMKAVAEAEAKHGYLKNAQKQYKPRTGSKPYTPTKYNNPPPKKPHWMTNKPASSSQKAKEPKTYRIAVTCTHVGYIAPNWGGVKLASFTVTKIQSKRYSMLLPIRSAPLNSSKIISGRLYIKNSSSNMSKIKSVSTKLDKIYAQYSKGKIWTRYPKKNYKQISKSSFGPFIVPDF